MSVLLPSGHFPNSSPPISSIEVWPSAQFSSIQVNNILKYNDLIVTGQVTFDDITVGGLANFYGGVHITGGDSSNPSNGALVIDGGIGVSGNVNVGGYVSATVINSLSDERQKKEITIIEDALGIVKGVQAVKYKFRHFNKKVTPDKRYHYGVLAQDLKENGLADLVTENKSGQLTVNYNDIVGILLKSVQELDQKLDTVLEKLEALSTR